MVTPETIDIQTITRQLQASREVPAELMEIFREEAEEHLRVIYEALDQLQSTADDPSALANFRRAAHTLKGAAGAVGMASATQLSHRMEDLLDQLAAQQHAPNADQLGLLCESADLLQELTTGDVAIEVVVPRLMSAYQRFEKSSPGQSSVAATLPEPASGTKKSDPTQTPASDQPQGTSETAPGGPPAQARFLRVPLPRLDDLVSTLGEMIVNRSALNQRLETLESRIGELLSTLQRTQVASDELQRQHQLEHAAPGNPARSPATEGDGSPLLDSLEFDQYTDFHLLAQILAEGTGDLEIVANELHALKSELDQLLHRQTDLQRDAQNSLMQVRMVPISSVVSKWQRTVRTVSKKLNKQTQLLVSGERTELDKTVIDEIVDPLQHLLRNALDHGVETAAERMAAGKPEQATVRLEAFSQGTQVTIKISDDGKGIDLERVHQQAIRAGLIPENEPLTRETVFRLIFQPGLSTARELTEVSGRGVGMDVVREAIARLNGSIRVSSETGRGTTFTIQLPTTVGVVQVLLVEAGQQRFAIPMSAVTRITRMESHPILRGPQTNRIQIEHRQLPLRVLAQHLQLAPATSHAAKAGSPLLILRVVDEEVAMSVDAILAGQEVVVKNLGDQLRQVPGVIGATVRGDGAILPILDPVDLVGRETDDRFQSHPAGLARSAPASVRVSTAMVIDDSISVRQVTTRLLQKAGWDVVNARDGVDALEKLETMETPPDVFLCDMEMPRMNGIELVHRLRRQAEFQHTPIVMVTSRASEKHRDMAFAAAPRNM